MSDSLSATADPQFIPAEFEDRTDAAWPAIFSLTMGVFGLVTAEFLPASLLTPIAAELGISDGAAGQAVTATAVIGAIAGIATAIMTRSIDRRIVMWALTSLLVVSSLLAAVATGLTTLLFARLLLGIGLGGFWSMAAATAMRLVPARLLPRAMSIIFTGVSVATVSAAPIGAYLGEAIGWRAVFAISAGIGAVTLLAQVLTLPKLPPLAAPSIGTLFELLGRPSIRLVLFAVLVIISGHFAGFTYVRPFLEQVPLLKVEAISLVLLAYGVGGFFGNFAGGAVVARSVKAAVVLGSLAIGLAALTMLLFGASTVVSGLAIALWGFAFGFLPVGIQTWTVRVAADQAEAAGGLLVAAFQIAIAGGAIFGGLLVDHLGALGAVGYLAAATLLGAALVLGVGREPPAAGGAAPALAG
ncbi:Arabinose efflux permease family protein precursor [Bosea sp. LC85]|uniref:MFS transporter n=1 Tax=Bosea sp. LC85 TaxID=1502851 RepID=UPI0004E36AC6|nr:MFS transporter [Bosea sp. LC85]KFC73800.1 Arabinose efflux permease family protein precursor [Bosea sp. LC85]